jgi:phosphoribosyl 1,2-cyclic phosphate phosphodiesterase
LKVTFLGTGTSQGVPVIACECAVCQSLDYRDKRLRSSVHIETDGQSIVIDSGPDFRQQMLVNRIQSLDALLITHAHKDHTAGMDDIRAFNFRQKKAMPVYGREETLAQLRREFAYAFAENKYPGTPEIELKEIRNEAFMIGNTRVVPILVMHYKMPVFGFRLHDFTYITDASFISEEELDKISGSKVLVLNALRHTEHIAHFNLSQALALAKRLNIPRTYFTHMSHQIGLSREMNKELPPSIQLAHDGLTLSIED